MRTSPALLGAIAAVLVTGVACGAELGKVPPMRQAGIDTVLPESRTPAALWEPRFVRPAQDQYAIDTPEGRFEVHELSDRGLYRTARFSQTFAYAQAYEPNAAAFDAELAIAELAMEPAPYLASRPVAAGDEAASNRAPALASAGTQEIDVAAELAARDDATRME
jgi:hypothetical protein